MDKDGTDYLVKLNGIGSGDNVELHGYWDRQAVSLVSQNEDESNYLPTFKAQEEKIARKTVFYRQTRRNLYALAAPMCHPCSGYSLFCLC